MSDRPTALFASMMQNVLYNSSLVDLQVHVTALADLLDADGQPEQAERLVKDFLDFVTEEAYNRGFKNGADSVERENKMWVYGTPVTPIITGGASAVPMDSRNGN